MTKPDFLYNQGIKIMMYSVMESDQCKVGWHREGTDIAYYKNQIQRKGAAYYTLTFTIESKYSGDEIYLATDIPYTYTDLMKKIDKWCNPKNCLKVHNTPISKTFIGNNFPMLTITNYSSTNVEIASRPVIFFTARVHPGYI